MQNQQSRPSFLKANFSFISQFIRNPKEMGALVPSSPLLGRAMAKFVPKKENLFVVELGPGTGPITKALIKSGLQKENLICLEMSSKMVTLLQRRFPELNILEGDASKLTEILQDKAGKVDAIVSSLPLRSIPKEIVGDIINEMHNVLTDDGIIIQFTYDLRPKRSPLLEKFKRIKSKIVIGNVPPARVDVFQKIDN
jgi:phosphatidylethanolamine/phosphatidyl-N-methylethanolamine N-methyltransferase